MTATATTLPGETGVRERSRTENFSVAALVLGARARTQLLAIYDFARFVDELGDGFAGDRLAALDEAERELDRALAGTATHPVFRRLEPLIRERGLGREPFVRLIEANRRDQLVQDYESWEQLVDYCELSANPVGELVLDAFEVKTHRRLAQSNDVCTALQVIEHIQDVGEDARNGRIYLPRDDRKSFGVAEDDLVAASASPQLRRLLQLECGRADALLASGVPLVRSLGGRARIAVAGYVAGGRAALDALRRADYDVLSARPTAGAGARLRASLLLLGGAA